MKKLYFSFVFILATLATIAAPRSNSEKMAIAKSMLQSTGKHSTRTHLSSLKVIKENTALTIIGEEQAGYVIIANDDRFHAILGYSDRSFQENVPGLDWWLKAATEVMTASAEAGNTPNNYTVDKVAIPQLMESEWGQGAPYNNLCPNGKRGKCPTGCVATAMSQVLYFHQYPERTVGKGSYTYGGKTFAQNLSGINYAWDKMQPRYDTPSGEGCEDVATLLFDCGLSINMNYDDGGSGAYNFEASTAMKRNFSMYSTFYDRAYYTSTEWMDLIYDQLSHNKPVIYGGVSDSDEGLIGHSFVIDGYREDGLVHVNWGWDGIGNGYYDIALLDPVVSGESMSFSKQQNFVVCQKEPLTVYSNIGMNSISIQKLTDTSISVRVTGVTNLLPDDFKGQVAIVAEKDGNKHVLSSVDQKLVYGVIYSTVFTETEYSVTDLEDGEYRIYAAAKSATDSDWQIFRAKRGVKNSYILTKENGTFTVVADNNAWSTDIHSILNKDEDKAASITYVYNINGQQVYSAPSATFRYSDIPVKGILLIKKGTKVEKIIKK